MPKKILQKESLVLRKISKNVALHDIGSLKINKIIEEMKVALDSQIDGVAIAAPQIGYSFRIFVVSKRVNEILNKSKKTDGQNTNEEYKTKKSLSNDHVFINPVLKKLSKEYSLLEEGCLSVRYLYGKVKRSKQATIEAYDENGKKFSRGATGLLSQIFQHEVDHLEGILFIDKAKDIQDIPPEDLNQQNG